jgi:glycosyltransferase involved in cell wall biosynthesis
LNLNARESTESIVNRVPMGGTELMYEGLKARVDPNLLNQFHIICSRLPEVLPKDKPIILWLHDLWNDPAAAHLRDAQSRDRFAKLVFVSNYQQQTFNMGLGVPYANGVVLQNAIEPIPLFEKPTNRINLIYHTTPHRGLEILVPVFIELTKHFPAGAIHLDVYSSFAMYGWNERDVPYKHLFEMCRQHPDITYHGYQPNTVVREALQRAHIFAYPSIWPETSCIAAIEALDAGCEVVCSNFAALPETTANFAHMYHMHEDINQHADIFAQVLFTLIEKYKHGTSVARRFRKTYFDSIYNWEGRALQWTSLLKQLLNTR